MPCCYMRMQHDPGGRTWHAMTLEDSQEQLVEKTVTYTLLKDDKFYIIEGVPARVNVETGEQLFSPETVEKLQRIIWEQK
jgi:hypothetical protein